MNVYEIINENDVKEAIPFTKQWGRERQAKKDVKGDISNMTSDLKTWMKGSGLKTITADQFKSFLDQKGLDTSAVDSLENDRVSNRSGIEPDAPMTSSEVKQYLQKAVRAGFQSQGARGTQSRFARPQTPPAGGSGGGGSSLPANITSAISSLTPAQKTALKAML